MARSPSSRRQETLYVPFVEAAHDKPGYYVVKIREGAGANYIATDPYPKRMAMRRMRLIREEMFKAWLATKSSKD